MKERGDQETHDGILGYIGPSGISDRPVEPTLNSKLSPADNDLRLRKAPIYSNL